MVAEFKPILSILKVQHTLAFSRRMRIITDVNAKCPQDTPLGARIRKTLSILKREGLVRPRELEEQGILREMLRFLASKGLVELVG